MSAPKFAPTPVLDVTRAYGSPDVAPASWVNDRPTDIEGFQPAGDHLGYQGPDQGYALLLANRLRSRLQLIGGVSSDDAVRGCLNIALRRASLFSRAPVIHDLTIAFTIWGFFDAHSPMILLKCAPSYSKVSATCITTLRDAPSLTWFPKSHCV